MHFCSVQTSKVIGGTWRPYPPLPMAPSPASAQRPGQRQPPTTPSLQASPAVAAAATAAASVQSSQRPSPRPDMSQVSPAARPASGAQQPTVNGVLMGQAQAQADAKERATAARAKFSLRSKKPVEEQQPLPLSFDAGSPQVKRLRRDVESSAGDAASHTVRRERVLVDAPAAEEVLDASQSPDSQRTDLPGSGDSLTHFLQSPPVSPAAASWPAPCRDISADSQAGARARAVRLSRRATLFFLLLQLTRSTWT